MRRILKLPVARILLVSSLFWYGCTLQDAATESASVKLNCPSEPTTTRNAAPLTPRSFLSVRTAGFYTTGFILTVDSIVARQKAFRVADQPSQYLARAAAYQLEARKLLKKDGDNAYVPIDVEQWAEAVKRARSDQADYVFRGIFKRETLIAQPDLQRDLTRLVSSAAFRRVRQETTSLKAMKEDFSSAEYRSALQRQLWHHGYVWVPMMTLLSYIELNGRPVIDAIASTGVATQGLPSGIAGALELLLADGIIIQRNGMYVVENEGWADEIRKLSRWAGLLASYDTLGDAGRIREGMATSKKMSFVDSRTLNIRSSGGGLPGFYKDFVKQELSKLVAQGLSTVIDVGTGAGGLLKLIHNDFKLLDLFASDLEPISLDVARQELERIITKPGRFLDHVNVLNARDLYNEVAIAYQQEALDASAIHQKLAHSVVTNAFITHEVREMSLSEAQHMMRGYAELFPHVLMLEIPLLDASEHAKQIFPQQGVEIIVFHLASGQEIRPLAEWEQIFQSAGYNIVAKKSFNRLLKPETLDANNPQSGVPDDNLPVYIGYHLSIP